MAATTLLTRELTRLSEGELFDTYFRERDLAVRDELVARFAPLARTLALRHVPSREPLDDLVQVGYVGLLNAIDRFDPRRGTRFVAFAAPTIIGEVKRYFRDKGWPIHVPRDLQERALAISQHAERFSIELGRSPTVVELARALGCTLEQAVEAIHVSDSYQPSSLDSPVDDDDDHGCSLEDVLIEEDSGFELAEYRQVLGSNWADLPEVEREVLGLRLVESLTQREISQRIGCSQVQISRLLRRALRSLNRGELPACRG